MQKGEKYILQSVDNALTVLELLARHEELSALEVAGHLGMGKSTAFRLLTTLASRNFVSKTRESKYRLGLKLASLGSIVTDRIEIIALAHPELVALTQSCRETSHLVMWAGEGTIQFVDKVSTHSSIQMGSMAGLRMPAHHTGTGKVLLAYRSPEEQEEYCKSANFEPVTPHTITNTDYLMKILGDIRRDGYGFDLGESEVGLTCFAAPILDFRGTAIAAISLSGSTERMQARKEELLQKVRETAAAISQKLL